MVNRSLRSSKMYGGIAVVEEVGPMVNIANNEAHVRDDAKVGEGIIVFVTEEYLVLRAAEGSMQGKAPVLAYRNVFDTIYS
jgi:hypothetical protein